jgi:hypothetical protein
MGRDIGGDYNIKVSPKRVKNKTIRDAVYKKEKNTRGGKDFTSTRGFKIKARAGDKTVTNKKGEKVVVRKSGNRVVTKKSGDVVRRKANGDRVISKKGKTRPTGPYVRGVQPDRESPYSTFQTTVTGRETPPATSEYPRRQR